MITKERLEEIREKDERVFILIDDKPISAKLNSLCLQIGYVDGKEHFVLFDPDDRIISITNEDLFETKEDAEEYLKYGNISREEKLELPTWEEFKNFKKSIIFRVLSKDIIEEDDTIFQCYNNGNAIIIYNDFNSSRIFNKPLTRENYNEARDLCVKLFIGEE